MGVAFNAPIDHVCPGVQSTPIESLAVTRARELIDAHQVSCQPKPKIQGATHHNCF